MKPTRTRVAEAFRNKVLDRGCAPMPALYLAAAMDVAEELVDGFAPEPPTLPEVRVLMAGDGRGPDAFIGTDRGYMTEDQAAFGARLLNALPTLRAEADISDIESLWPTADARQTLSYAGRLRTRMEKILSILNDEPEGGSR